MARILASSPHFLVRDLATAGRYYEEKLGFKIAEYWGDPPVFAMPNRDGIIVMLNQVDELELQPNGQNEIWDAYFWCSDVEELYAEFRETGADIMHRPEFRQRYRMREMAVRDLDGYMLVFAQRTEA
jgi:predicted lactoylglutathione lyase